MVDDAISQIRDQITTVTREESGDDIQHQINELNQQIDHAQLVQLRERVKLETQPGVTIGTQTDEETKAQPEESKRATAIEATIYQSELLKQIMQVGSLFNLKAFGTEEESKADADRRTREMKERALKKQI